MKYLIVNADDFGASRGIDRGIIEAHQRGVLTSTSLLVNATASGEAAELSRSAPDLSVGLHADLVACRDYANGLQAAAVVECRSLVLLGARDIMAPARAARELAATLRDVSAVTIDCGHSMMSEEPDAVLDALLQFLL